MVMVFFFFRFIINRMIDEVVRHFKSLEKKDFKTLRGIENGMKTFEWVPVDEVAVFAGLPLDEVKYRLDRLSDFELIIGKKIGNKRFKLTFDGYDALAMNVFINRDSIDSIGGEVGVGKESEVRKAKWKGNEVIIKFHREGKISFRDVKKERNYLGKREHSSKMFIAKLAAEKEYKALKNLSKDVRVPKVFDYNRHSIIMENIEGEELTDVKLDSSDAEFIFNILKEEIKNIYKKGFVHGDLSEFNVLISEKELKIIDWSQVLKVDSHPNVREILKRDIKNICNYFNRKYNLGVNEEEVLDFVLKNN